MKLPKEWTAKMIWLNRSKGHVFQCLKGQKKVKFGYFDIFRQFAQNNPVTLQSQNYILQSQNYIYIYIYIYIFFFSPTDTTCQYNLYRYYVVYMLLFHCYCYLLSCIHCTHKFLGTFCTLVMWNKLNKGPIWCLSDLFHLVSQKRCIIWPMFVSNTYIKSMYNLSVYIWP